MTKNTRPAQDPDWSSGCADSHLDIMRRAAPADLPVLANSYDWSAHPESVLGWVMAQKTIDLGSAVAIFQRGQPERFNYVHKRAVPFAFRATARVLDNICLRVNCGFYLPRAGGVGIDAPTLNTWIEAQRADRASGACGRWVLDETILSSLTHPPTVSAHPVPASPDGPTRPAWLTRRFWGVAMPERPDEILTRE
ncbi:hypothetical protein OO012_01705 [Rhodobacteraceae bacterium KMM 6894]|nr:hypothetical protein [Rhodobacteraceae bacterium KMM 6894]